MKGICGGRGKEHGLLLLTETPLICVANKPEQNRWGALDNIRQVLSLYPGNKSRKSGTDYYVVFEVSFLPLMLSFCLFLFITGVISFLKIRYILQRG